MKKNFKRKFMVLTVLAICCILGSSLVKGQSTEVPAIPEQMYPNAVILYDKDLKVHNIDVKEDNSVEDGNSDSLPPQRGDTSGMEEEEKLVAEIRKEAEHLPQYYITEKYLPTPNTMVIYGSDGIINRIVQLDEKEMKMYLPN